MLGVASVGACAGVDRLGLFPVVGYVLDDERSGQREEEYADDGGGVVYGVGE